MARGVKGMWPRRRLLALADDLLDLGADGLQRDAEALERLRGDALTLVDETEQDVLGADVVVAEHAGFFLGQHDHPSCSVGEPLEHVFAPRQRTGAPALRCAGAEVSPSTLVRPPEAAERGSGDVHRRGTGQAFQLPRPARCSPTGSLPANARPDVTAASRPGTGPAWPRASRLSGRRRTPRAPRRRPGRARGRRGRSPAPRPGSRRRSGRRRPRPGRRRPAWSRRRLRPPARRPWPM